MSASGSIGSLVIDDNDPFYIQKPSLQDNKHCHGTDSSVGGSSQQMRNSRSSRESSILSTEDASSYKSRCTEEGEEEVDEELGCNGSSSLSSGQSPPATGGAKSRPKTLSGLNRFFSGSAGPKTCSVPPSGSSVPIIITERALPSGRRRGRGHSSRRPFSQSLVSTPDREFLHIPESRGGTPASTPFGPSVKQGSSSSGRWERQRRHFNSRANSRLSLDEAGASPAGSSSGGAGGKSIPKFLRNSFNKLVGSLTGSDKKHSQESDDRLDRARASSFAHYTTSSRGDSRAGSLSPDQNSSEGWEIPNTPHTRAYIEEMKSRGLPVIPFAHPAPLPEADLLQEIAEKEPCQNDCSSNDPSNKNKSALKSQTSLDDDYFDFDRHRPLESLVDLAQQEWMNEHNGWEGSIDLPTLSSSHTSSSGGKGKKSTTASIINNNDLFYTPQDVSGHHHSSSINFIGERLRAPSNNLNSSNLLCSDEGYLDMTLGLKDLRLHSGALPVSNIK